MLTTAALLLLIAGFACGNPPSVTNFNIPEQSPDAKNPPINDLMSEDTYVLSYAEYENTWEEFKRIHNKVYKDAVEEGKRFSIFMENVKFIEHHNWRYHNKRSTFYLGLNHLADITDEEYQQKKGFVGSSVTFCEPYRPATTDVPQSVDWRQKGYVTPVKDQGYCGSCWAFSSTGAIEGQWFKAKGKLVSLSEQQLVDCVMAGSDDDNCPGGEMDIAFKYIIKAGLETEAEYPYIAKLQQCHYNRSESKVRISGCADVLPRGDEDALKVAVGNIGPVSIGIDANSTLFKFYSGGVFDNPECSSTKLDHGILAVGYGTFKEQDFWLIKNSWAETWGIKGYGLMSRNKNNQCGIATEASFPVV